MGGLANSGKRTALSDTMTRHSFAELGMTRLTLFLCVCVCVCVCESVYFCVPSESLGL